MKRIALIGLMMVLLLMTLQSAAKRLTDDEMWQLLERVRGLEHAYSKGEISTERFFKELGRRPGGVSKNKEKKMTPEQRWRWHQAEIRVMPDYVKDVLPHVVCTQKAGGFFSSCLRCTKPIPVGDDSDAKQVCPGSYKLLKGKVQAQAWHELNCDCDK